jgi:hypothetical protein
MANCDEHIDLRKAIQSLPVRMPEDYVAVYDSTMARFWFLNDRARQVITDGLQGVSQGRILPEAELKRLKTYFPDHYFGELIFLVKEGMLIVPSDMGARPIRAMHGYHPNEIHSFAALCTNQEGIPDDVRAIPDMYRLMVQDAELARARNSNTVAEQTRNEACLPAEAQPARHKRKSEIRSSRSETNPNGMQLENEETKPARPGVLSSNGGKAERALVEVVPGPSTSADLHRDRP